MGEAELSTAKLASGCENKVMRNNPWVVITHTESDRDRDRHTAEQHDIRRARVAHKSLKSARI